MAKRKKNIHKGEAPSFKCKLCGELIKVTQWRKHLCYKHNVGELPKYVNYFNEISKDKCKCKICRKKINKLNWREHLYEYHNIGENLTFRHYFVNPKYEFNKVTHEWYNPDRKAIEKDWHCGDVLNGPPKVSLIFNAVCSSKRKH